MKGKQYDIMSFFNFSFSLFLSMCLCFNRVYTMTSFSLVKIYGKKKLFLVESDYAFSTQSYHFIRIIARNPQKKIQRYKWKKFMFSVHWLFALYCYRVVSKLCHSIELFTFLTVWAKKFIFFAPVICKKNLIVFRATWFLARTLYKLYYSLWWTSQTDLIQSVFHLRWLYRLNSTSNHNKAQVAIVWITCIGNRSIVFIVAIWKFAWDWRSKSISNSSLWRTLRKIISVLEGKMILSQELFVLTQTEEVRFVIFSWKFYQNHEQINEKCP